MRCTRKTMVVALVGLLPLGVAAEISGFSAGGGAWNPLPEAFVAFQGDYWAVDPRPEARNPGKPALSASFRQARPLLPKVRFSSVSLDANGTGSASEAFVLGRPSSSAEETLRSHSVVEQRDVALYYELRDTSFSADLGLDLKYLEGAVQDRSGPLQDRSSVSSYSGLMPLPYGRVRADLPFVSGLSAGVEGGYLSYQGDSVSDYRLKLRYETDSWIGFEAGYRRQQIRLDEFDDVSSTVTVDGAYVGLYGSL